MQKNDDDRRTTSTQLSRAVEYTIEDLRKGILLNKPGTTHSQMLDCLESGDELTSCVGASEDEAGPQSQK